MKKISTFLLGLAVSLSASALTLDDLTGNYELQYAYGSTYYIAEAGAVTFGLEEGDAEKNAQYIDAIKVTTDGEYLYFSNFLGLSFYGVADLENGTVTLPVQSVSSPTGYSFTQCLYDSRMFPAEGETAATFTDDDAQAIVLNITEDGDLSLWREDDQYWDYIAYWGWSTNYGWLTGIFHKTSSFEADASLKDIIGAHECNVFKGEWNSIWGEWDNSYSVWNKFDITTGEGVEEIGVDAGPFTVNINTLGGLEVEFAGLWWGGFNITGTYDPETKTFTFPLQTVWGGYTLCNSSLCDVEVPTADDVVPATAVVNEDGSITMNYTVEYANYPYLYATQVLGGAGASIGSIAADDANAAVEYYNLQGMKVANPVAGRIYIVRQGNNVTKQLVK